MFSVPKPLGFHVLLTESEKRFDFKSMLFLKTMQKLLHQVMFSVSRHWVWFFLGLLKLHLFAFQKGYLITKSMRFVTVVGPWAVYFQISFVETSVMQVYQEKDS